MRQLLFVFGSCVALLGCAPTAPDQPAEDTVLNTDATDKPFYLTLDVPPAPVLSAQEELKTFVLAEGYDISLVASEPLVEDPVALDWDEDGNLYIAEMRAYMPTLEGEGEEEPIGALVRLIDSDGDGVFDEKEVLADDLVLPRALRITNEGLLIGEMGKLWLCPTDTGWSRDIDCGKKRLLGEYGVHQGSVEHAENGLLVGLDNWLYSAKSTRRLNIVDGELVEEPTVFRGQWGITQDDFGRLFYNTNSNMLLGDYYDAQASVAAGNKTGPGFGQRISTDDEVFSVRVNPGVNRAYLPGVLRDDGRLRSATSASGMTIYYGGQMGDLEGAAFVAEPAANLVAAYRLREEGVRVASDHVLYTDENWGQRDFLASTDERFRPVDVQAGPDGALYVIDFYRGVIQDHVFLTEQLKEQARARGLQRPLGMGRIWRIAQADAEPASTLPDWRSLQTEGLLEHLSANELWRRSTAQRLLLRSDKDDVQEKLLATVINPGSVTTNARIRAIFILDGRGELDSNAVASIAAASPNAAVLATLLQAGGEQLDSELLFNIISQADIESRVYLYAIAALRFVADTDEVVGQLAAVLERPANAHVQAFVLAAARGVELQLMRQQVALNKPDTTAPLVNKLAQQALRADRENTRPILDYLLTAPTWVQAAVASGMQEVTREPGFERVVLEQSHGFFDITDEALWPIVAQARKAYTWPGDTLAADAKPLTPLQAANMAAGRDFYASSCANCHGVDGRGIGALGPPLADSQWVVDAPERLARIVLHGVQGPIEVLGQTWNSAMPGHIHFPGFDDATASGLLTYLRRSWGHAGRAIDPEFVAKVRSKTEGRAALWTADELLAIDINTHYRKYEGTYGPPGRGFAFNYDGKDLIVSSGIFNGPVIEQKEDHFLFAPRDLMLEFVLADDGLVTGVRMATPEGGMVIPRMPNQ